MHPRNRVFGRIATWCRRVLRTCDYGPHGIVVGVNKKDKERYKQTDLSLDLPGYESRNTKALIEDMQNGKKQGVEALTHSLAKCAIANAQDAIGVEEGAISGEAMDLDENGYADSDAIVNDEEAIVHEEMNREAGWFDDMVDPITQALIQEHKDLREKGVRYLTNPEGMGDAMRDHAHALVPWVANVTYWGERLDFLNGVWSNVRGMNVEQEMGEVVFPDDNVRWEQYITEANIYTGMETANLGVYWTLQIDANGKTDTIRH